MSRVGEEWGLDDIEVSRSAVEASLTVVRRIAREKAEVAAQLATAMRLAQANGATLRQIAEAAGVSPQTVSNSVRR